MLARLDRIDGVERSFANRSGTLIRLSLTPTADTGSVFREAVRVLSNGDEENIPSRLSEEAVTEVLPAEEWRDASRIAELSAIESRTLRLRALLALALAGTGIGGVAFLWRRWRRATMRAANDRRDGAA